MADETVIPEAKVEATNPFASNAWADAAPETKIETKDEKVPDATVKLPEETATDEILEPSVWLKREFGWDSPEVGKQEIDGLRKKAESAEMKFANEQSERYFNSLREGKEDDVYQILHDKKQLERAEKLDVTDVKNAAEVIKLAYAYKYRGQDLSSDEINDLFQEQYSKPEKPIQQLDQEEDQYKEEVNQWKTKCEAIDKKIIRDAKISKPDLVKFKSELVLPELPKKETPPHQPTQESLDAAKKVRENFINKLESDSSKVEGFSTKVKDESVEIPVLFKIPDEDRVAIVQRLKNGLDVEEYMGARWFGENGEPKIDVIISDIFELENRDKVHSGIANNSATARLIEYKKETSKINVTGTTQQTYKPGDQTQSVNPFSTSAWSEKPPASINN